MQPSKRIRIVGEQARSIADHVRSYVKPGRTWSEAQVMRECDHGCKLYVRKRGAVLQYALVHSTNYGCTLGRDTEKNFVPVTVAPKAVK